MSVAEGQIRKRWNNYVDTAAATPLKYFKPSSLADLVEIVHDAEKNGYKVKAIGSGHSSSDIAKSRDYMVDTHGLNNVLDINNFKLKSQYANSSDLWFIECGLKLCELNEILDKRGKALFNMPAYTGQTIAGAMSTSTHGSGISLGSIPTFIEAIILVGENGNVKHIERSANESISEAPVHLKGISNVEYIQSDEEFNAVAVSIGCLGIIYAVVIRVTDSYWLKENRRFSTWAEVKKELLLGKILKDNRHLEVLVNPYRYHKTAYKCMVTERNIAEDKRTPVVKRGHRKLIPELMVRIVPDFILNFLLRLIINYFPTFVPSLVEMLIATLTDKSYIDKNYNVLDLGGANNLSAYSTEIALPSDRYIEAVETIIAVIEKSSKEAKQYYSSPFSLRFIKTNGLFLSMQYGAKVDDFVCMIEFPVISKTVGSREILARIESAMYAYGGVPHWGALNHIGGNADASPGKLYPEFGTWMSVYKKYCKIGLFENDFTKRCGIEAENNGNGRPYLHV